MEFNPPVEKRTNKELFNIIGNDEKWINEIQVLAKAELIKRNIPISKIEAEKNRRIGILKRKKERELKMKAMHKVESYSFTEMLIILILAPLNLFLFWPYTSEFSKLSAGNYKRKFWQRIALYLISFAIWIFILSFIY